MVNPLESHVSPEQKWVLMVDNQRMDLGAFNQRNLNMLPLNLNLIDSVVVSTIPRIQNGEFSEYGMIHIYTCRPLSGATFQYRYVVGNETGDPGPWTFTEYATENIDRTVMDHFSTLSIGLKKHVWGHIGFSSNYFPATDRALRKRFQNYPWEWIRVFVFSPFLQIGADAFGGEHHLNIGYASAGNSPWMSTDGSDLLFFRPLSREIPVESAFSHIGLDGIWPVNSSMSILYRWKQSVNTINNVDHYNGILFDWRMRNDYGNLEFRFTKPDWNGEIGIGYDRFYLKTKYDIRGNTITLTKLYGKVSFDRLKNCSPAFHFYLTTNGEKVTAKTSLINIWTLNQHQQITSGLSFSQRLPDEDHNFWFWTRRGYNLLNDSTIEYYMDGDLQNNQHTNFFIKWKYRSNKSDLSIKGFIRRNKDVIAENQTFYFEDENISSSYMTVHTNVSGDVIGSQIRFQHSLFQHVILHCSYINTFPLKTDDVFKRELERFPQHKAFIVFNYEPVPSFHLQANFTFLSSTKCFFSEMVFE